MEKEFYSIKEAAELLKLNPATVRRRIKSGELSAELVEGVYGNQYKIPAAQIKTSTQAEAYRDIVTVTRQVTIAELETSFDHSINKAIQNAIAPLVEEIKDLRTELNEQRRETIKPPEPTKTLWQRWFG